MGRWRLKVVQSVSGINAAVVSNINKFRSGTGRVSVPVSPHLTRYAQFKHIEGIPAVLENGGVPVSKLRLLDSLIEKLIGQKGRGKSFLKVSNESIDSLITKVKNEIKLNAKSIRPNNVAGGPVLSKGLFLNVFA